MRTKHMPLGIRFLGKGEVDSSILSGSTSGSKTFQGLTLSRSPAHRQQLGTELHPKPCKIRAVIEAAH